MFFSEERHCSGLQELQNDFIKFIWALNNVLDYVLCCLLRGLVDSAWVLY